MVLSVANKPVMLNVVMLSVVILSVVAPSMILLFVSKFRPDEKNSKLQFMEFYDIDLRGRIHNFSFFHNVLMDVIG